MVEAYFHKDKLINVILNAFRLMNEDNLIDDVEVLSVKQSIRRLKILYCNVC